MMQIKFLGAAGTVTGSCFLLSHANSHLLVDFGMFQGVDEIDKLNYNPLQFDPSKLSGVLLTHAHLDHCGRLPLLVKNGFTGKVYMTEATKDIISIALQDAVQIAQKSPDIPLMYSSKDVDILLSQIETKDYEQPFTINEFQVVMQDAGHILGSTWLNIYLSTLPQRRIVFSGDLGNYPSQIVRPTEFVKQASVVILESTYGDRKHKAENAAELLAAEVNSTEQSNSTLLIPCFSIERTQELLHILNHLKQQRKISKSIPVFLDSPMAIKVTRIYKRYTYLFNQHLTNHSAKEDPFDFPGLVMMEKKKDSRIHRQRRGKVIIAGSGMMTGGKIINHAARYLPQSRTRLLFVGYQAEDTLGREILQGAKNIIIKKRNVTVRATVNQIQSMSAHADQQQLLSWLSNAEGIEQVFLVHGEDKARSNLAAKIKTNLSINKVILPKLNQSISLTAV